MQSYKKFLIYTSCYAIIFCGDYINSIVHEAEHIKQAMLNAYQVEDAGEPPAYTIGYLIGRMWEVGKKLLGCNC